MPSSCWLVSALGDHADHDAGSDSFEATLEQLDGVGVSVPVPDFGSGLDEHIGIGAWLAVNGTLVATEA